MDALVGDYICDACPEGYEGLHCERYEGLSPRSFVSRVSSVYAILPSGVLWGTLDPRQRTAAVASHVTAVLMAHIVRFAMNTQDSACVILGLKAGSVIGVPHIMRWSMEGVNVSLTHVDFGMICSVQHYRCFIFVLFSDCLVGCTGELNVYATEVEVILNDFNSSASALLPWARLNIIERQIPKLKVSASNLHGSPVLFLCGTHLIMLPRIMVYFQGILKASNTTAQQSLYAEISDLKQAAKSVSSKVR